MKELSVFKTGNTNDAFAEYFVGQSYLNMLTTERIGIGNITFGLQLINFLKLP